jgi:Arc/MetJ-type ribon-helix-helix transcriptional regulator
MARVNKEKQGMTVRFSVRLPKEIHSWLKARSQSSETYLSMNEIIKEALEEYIMK